MNPLLALTPVIAFVCTFLLTMKWIPTAFRAGLIGKDMNKPNKPPVAEMGGVAVLGGVLAGLFYYISLNTFILNQASFNLELFATLSTIIVIAFIGLIDDFLGWKIGLKQWQKPLLTIPAALPIMVINAGHSSMSLPFIGDVNFGILYPLLIVPIGIVGASNGFNMLAGYNGLEVGMGTVVVATMTLVVYLTGNSWVAIIGLVTLASLIAFLIFNWYPSKIFPGNAFTYMIGAIIACMAILGNVEKLAVILFIPYMIDFFLPLRSKMKAEAFAKVNEDGSLEKPYDKIYDITHLMIALLKKIKRKVYERDVTISLIVMEIILAAIGMMLYF